MHRLMLAALVLATGCAGASPYESQDPQDRLGVWVPDPSATILRTALSSLEDPTQSIVSDPVTWRAVWSQAWGGAQASPILPDVDFVLASVVVVGLGKRTGLGYAVSIDSIVVRTVGSVLYATESRPGAHCGASAGAFAPVHMVHAPGHLPIIEWRLGTTTRDCAP